MSLTEVQLKFGMIVNGKWPNEKEHMVLLAIDPTVSTHWINSATLKPTNHIYCNKVLVDPLLNALDKIEARGLLWCLETFDGVFNIRDRRGQPGIPSAHSWGLAIDINALTNPMGSQGNMPEELVSCFVESGFYWGKHFSNPDPQHFSLTGF